MIPDDNTPEPWWILPALILLLPILAVVGACVEGYNALREWARGAD